jgi:hypothetical protein
MTNLVVSLSVSREVHKIISLFSSPRRLRGSGSLVQTKLHLYNCYDAGVLPLHLARGFLNCLRVAPG